MLRGSGRAAPYPMLLIAYDAQNTMSARGPAFAMPTLGARRYRLARFGRGRVASAFALGQR
jgi:hypothetical protein